MKLHLVPNLAAALNPAVAKREMFGWAMYDFASSAYTTVVITTVYNAFFVATVCEGARWGTLAWTLALSLSYLLILLTAPALGVYADQRARKKRLLMWFTAGCVLGTLGLMLTGPGTVWLALALIVFSNFCFGSGENLTAAFLPELARPTGMGRISGFSWALGYVGGLLALVVCLLAINGSKRAGLDAGFYVPATMLVTAVFFVLGSLCTFVWLRERALPQQHQSGLKQLILASLSDTWTSLKGLRAWPELKALLVCILAYQAGIQTIITLAAIYATQALGFSTEQTLVMICVVNITAAIGAAGFGFLQDRLGHRLSLALCLLGWILTIVLLGLSHGLTMFWIAANLAGLNLGAAQSAGRAMVGYLAPPTRTGEFFGLWGLSVKAASILGPLTYGLLSYLTHNNHRVAMLATGLFFIAGLLLLLRVDVQGGHRRAVG